jgi:hypothetical protein
VEVVRGLGTLGVILGLALVISSFAGPFRFSPRTEPKMAKWWPISRRIGWKLLGVGVVLLLISLL